MPNPYSLSARRLPFSLNLWQQCCDSTPCIWKWSKSQPSTVFWPAALFNLQLDGEFGLKWQEGSFAIFITQEDVFILTQKGDFEFSPVSDGETQWIPASKIC